MRIAAELNRQGIATPRRSIWRSSDIWKLLKETEVRFRAIAELGSKAFRKLRRAKLFAPIIAPLRDAGWTYDAIAIEFGRLGVPTPRKGAWRGSAVWKLHQLASSTGENGGEPQ